jgi:integrase
MMTSITARDVDLNRAHRLSQVSPTSVNIDLWALRSAFYTAVRWRLLAGNPFKKVPFLSIPDRQPAFLAKEDFHLLLTLISERWVRELVIVAVSTGMRRAELSNLTWKDVDFARRLLHIQSNETFRTKGGKRRTVPMSEVVFQLLWEKAQHSQHKSVFTLHGRRIYGNWLTCMFRRYIRKAGRNPKLQFHNLRHMFATWLVQEGVSIYEVQKLLGHSSISVTQVCSHLAASELHGAVNNISVALN